MRRKLETPTLAAVIDLVVVVAFVIIGRRNHDEGVDPSGVIETAAPFVVGLALGWLVGRAWRRPTAAVTGMAIWITTVVVGMVMRRFVFDDGTATAFVIVATVFLGAGINLWRLPLRTMRQSGALGTRGRG